MIPLWEIYSFSPQFPSSKERGFLLVSNSILTFKYFEIDPIFHGTVGSTPKELVFSLRIKGFILMFK
jgi:hypothetical protein